MSLRCRHGGAPQAGAAGAACAGAGGGAGPGEGRAAGTAGPHREHEPGGDRLQPLQVRPGGQGEGQDWAVGRGPAAVGLEGGGEEGSGGSGLRGAWAEGRSVALGCGMGGCAGQGSRQR